MLKLVGTKTVTLPNLPALRALAGGAAIPQALQQAE